MNQQLSSETRDALRVQVAAVVAQQAAVTEHEIHLGEIRTQIMTEQRALVADVESLLLHLLAQEEHLERQRAEIDSRETFIARLENASNRLVRELELVKHVLSREAASPMPHIRAA